MKDNNHTIQRLPENEVVTFTEALGWFELHAPEEALLSLKEISSAYQNHLEVLRLRWIILHQLKDFEGCKNIGASLTLHYPDQLDSWMLYAQSFYIVQDYQHALNTLKSVEEKFATDWHFAYDYACYHSLTNDFEGAQRWLDLAKKSGNAKKIEHMFLTDNDFNPYREHLRSQKEHPEQ